MVLVALDISPQGQRNHLGQPFANPGYLRLLTARVFGPGDGIYRPLFFESRVRSEIEQETEISRIPLASTHAQPTPPAPHHR